MKGLAVTFYTSLLLVVLFNAKTGKAADFQNGVSHLYQSVILGSRHGFSAGLTADQHHSNIKQLPQLFDNANLLKSNIGSNSTKCGRDLMLIAENVAKGALWALKCRFDHYYYSSSKHSNCPFTDADSQASKPSGLLNGNLKWFGEFDECLNIKSGPLPNNLVLTPRYCQLSIGSPNGSSLTNILAGVCVTDNCDIKDIADFINPLRKLIQSILIFFLSSCLFFFQSCQSNQW